MNSYTVTIIINNESVACYSAATLGYAYKTAKEARLTWGPEVYVEIKAKRHYEAFEGSRKGLCWLGRTIGSVRYFRPENNIGVDSVYEGSDGYERF